MRPYTLLLIIIAALYWYISPHISHAATYSINSDVVGEIKYYEVNKNDNLYAIARKFDVGIVELLAANPKTNIWKPKIGTKLTIPTLHILPTEPREGIIINLSELRLFYFPDSSNVMTFPISIGKKDWETRKGTTTIIYKRANPTWTPPESIRAENPELPDIIPSGADNPLGYYAMNLGWENFVIHGTNKPYSVGKRASHGCIRLYPEDIETLFKSVSAGTKVTVVDNHYKLGWHDNKLFLEVLPTQEQADTIAKAKTPKPLAVPELRDAIKQITNNNSEINWNVVDEEESKRSSVPVEITASRQSSN